MLIYSIEFFQNSPDSPPGDREDVAATMDRLIMRCRTVDVMVNTPRNEQQARALGCVNECIETQLMHRMHEDMEKSKEVRIGLVVVVD